jgi:hypothetical protein
MKRFCGATFEIGTSQTTSSAANIPLIVIFWISICPEARLGIDLMEAVTTTFDTNYTIKPERNFLPVRESSLLRFWNHQLCEDLDTVLETIWFELGRRRRSNPSP